MHAVVICPHALGNRPHAVGNCLHALVIVLDHLLMSSMLQLLCPMNCVIGLIHKVRLHVQSHSPHAL